MKNTTISCFSISLNAKQRQSFFHVPVKGLLGGLAMVVPGAEFGEAGVELERAADPGDVVVLDGWVDDQRLHRQVGDAERSDQATCANMAASS